LNGIHLWQRQDFAFDQEVVHFSIRMYGIGNTKHVSLVNQSYNGTEAAQYWMTQ